MTEDAAYPRFSPAEMDRRRSRFIRLLEDEGLEGAVVYGANRTGTAVGWLTGWPVTREAAVLVGTDGELALWVQFFNHLPNARQMAFRATVEWGGPSTAETVAQAVRKRGYRRIGVVGPIGHRFHARLAESTERVVDLDSAYVRLRLVKSTEELDWIKRGAELSDRAVLALRDQVKPGLDERALGAIVESSFLAEGAVNQIHYFAVTSMDRPDRCVPAQWPSTRRIRPGDVLVTEISASWWEYPGQVLRTMAVGRPPTKLYRELHDVAEAAYRSILATLRPGTTCEEIVSAGQIIEEAGFSIYDDLVHGYGGGYLPPVLRTKSTSTEPLPDLVLEEGMTLVVQPNVITSDERAGVQTGGLVTITADGVEELQKAPKGFWQVG